MEVSLADAHNVGVKHDAGACQEGRCVECVPDQRGGGRPRHRTTSRLIRATSSMGLKGLTT